MTAGPLVHGMGTELVEPDWSPLTDEEVRDVLYRYDWPGRMAGADGAQLAEAAITWRSPRPMSSAALVRLGTTTVFVKRHDRRVRTTAQLRTEHEFGRYLQARGQQAPTVLQTVRGETALAADEWVYEVHEAARGVDLYRNAMSWTPYTSLAHARCAGVALARFHRSAAGFGRPARRPAVLMTSCQVISSPEPVQQVGHLMAERPGLARYLDRRPWEDDLTRYHVPAVGRVAPLLRKMAPQWGHGDWHPSNLTWTSTRPDAEVAAVFDLGLANRTFAVHDLATAMERSAVSWLDLARTGRAKADLDQVAALLDGYQATRPLSDQEWAALPELLPVVHLEYALSEIEYFADVVRSEPNADLSYYTYLVGHARWFETSSGSELLDFLRGKARSWRRDGL
jgi:Ser/Thr protein kinase RdoA (MazF antagonist)